MYLPNLKSGVHVYMYIFRQSKIGEHVSLNMKPNIININMEINTSH